MGQSGDMLVIMPGKKSHYTDSLLIVQKLRIFLNKLMRRCRVHVAQLQQPDSCRLYSSYQDGENGEYKRAEPKFINI